MSAASGSPVANLPPPASSISRILHTMLRVGDLSRSIAFYTNIMGMKHLRTVDVPADEYTLVFLGYNRDDAPGSVLELTYNYGKTEYQQGTAYGHMAYAVPDVQREVSRMRALGIEFSYVAEDGSLAFLQDPDGYDIELLQEDFIDRSARDGTH